MRRLENIIIGDGEMAGRIREYDWKPTGLGGVSSWPQSLVTAVNIMLQSPVPLVMLWGKHGIMLYNDAYSVFAGGRHPSLLGSKVVEGWPEVADFNRNVLKVGLGGGILEYTDQRLTLHRHGRPEEVWMDLTYSPVIDERGKPAGVLAIVIEKTQQVLAERKQARAEAAVLTERERLHSLFMQAPAMIAVLRGPEHVFELANPLYMRLVGNRPIIGKPVLKALPELKGQEILDVLDTVYRTGKPFFGDELPVSLDRSGKGALRTTYFNFVYQPSFNGNDQVDGILVHAVEVTDLVAARRETARLNKRLETRVRQRTSELEAANKELERSNEELQDFAYVASHDLQEPLRKITAFSSLLASDYKDALPMPAHAYLDGLQRSSTRMRSLIDDLLRYSRVATNTQPFETVSLQALYEDSLDDLQARISETDATVTGRKLGVVTGDRLQLRLLLQNLISNALKYSRKDVAPRIKVSVERQEGWCLIHVQDNGIGFEQQYAEKIFTIFQRLHGKGEYEGTGIGLAICKKIAERHGGEILATSTVGKGSTFTVRLPDTPA